MKRIWLLGAGPMAIDYAKVLTALEKEFLVVGRSEAGCTSFKDATGHEAISGGVDKFLLSKPELPEQAIVAVSIENLAETCKIILDYGVKNILLEKPGVGYASEIFSLAEKIKKKNASVLLAYNRRFYSSVIKAKEMIKNDGGVVSFNFEFTEWSHQIRKLKKHKAEHHNWFLGNSTHVIDTAFYLGGKPKELCSFYKGGLDWHPASSVFSGAGESESGALFSYQANWEGPGRWVLEIITPVHRLIFKPMEKLQIQEIGSVAVNFVEAIDYGFDEQFKPGLYLQTEAFLKNDFSNFCTVLEQNENIEKYYLKMSGYSLTKSNE